MTRADCESMNLMNFVRDTCTKSVKKSFRILMIKRVKNIFYLDLGCWWKHLTLEKFWISVEKLESSKNFDIIFWKFDRWKIFHYLFQWLSTKKKTSVSIANCQVSVFFTFSISTLLEKVFQNIKKIVSQSLT